MEKTKQPKPDFYLVIECSSNASEMVVFSCWAIKRVGIKDKSGCVNRTCLLMRVEPPIEFNYIERFGNIDLSAMHLTTFPLEKLVALPRYGTLFPVMEWPVNVTLIHATYSRPELQTIFAPEEYLYLCEDAAIYPSEASARDPKGHQDELKYPQPRTLRRRLYTMFAKLDDKVMGFIKRF